MVFLLSLSGNSSLLDVLVLARGEMKKGSCLASLCDPPGLTCDPVGLISFTELLTHAKLLCLRGLSIVIVLSLNVLNLGTFLVAHLVAH